MNVCDVCQKKASSRCSNCKSVCYCSKQCQTQHWKTHKQHCSSLAKKNQQSSSAEENLHELVKSNSATVDQVKFVNKFLPTDPTIPKYHKEYQKAYPPDVGGYKFLDESYELQRSTTTERMLPIKGLDPSFVMRRWGPLTPELQQFLETAGLGTVYRNKPKVGYQANHFQSFGNTSPENISFAYGSTHVGVGFVDLGLLLYLQFDPYRNDPSKGRMKFVGIESCAYSIAKTRVIVEMLRQKSKPYSVMQVWFSSGWTRGTTESFKSAVDQVLKQYPSRGSIHQILSFWKEATPVSLDDTIKLWRKKTDPAKPNIQCNLTFEIDRVEVCRYILTGDVSLPQEQSSVGSITMFSNPPSVGERARDESVFTRITPQFKYNESLMQSVKAHLMEQITSIASMIQDDMIEFEFMLRTMNPEDSETHALIRKMNAFTMSWSNICDYMPRDKFLQMAKACSGSETVHYMHSMNWKMEVKGVNVLDFPDSTTRSMIIDETKNFFSSGEYESIRDAYLIRGLPKTNIMNTTSFLLCAQYRDIWVQYFFGKDAKVVAKDLTNFHIFKRDPSTLYLVFSFNTDMIFQINNK